MSSSSSSRSPMTIAPRTALASPSAPTARSRAPRASARASSIVRAGVHLPLSTRRTKRELLTRPTASRRWAARRRRASVRVVPGLAVGARRRHQTRIVSPRLSPSMRGISSAGTGAMSRRSRSSGTDPGSIVTTSSARPPCRSRSGAPRIRAVTSIARRGDAPNPAVRRRSASRQAHPWSAAPTLTAASAAARRASPRRRLRPVAAERNNRDAIPAAAGDGRGPPNALPRISAAEMVTSGARSFDGAVTAKGGGTCGHFSRAEPAWRAGSARDRQPRQRKR